MVSQLLSSGIDNISIEGFEQKPIGFNNLQPTCWLTLPLCGRMNKKHCFSATFEKIKHEYHKI